MKVSCQQEQLARGIGIVGRAVAARSTLPVLSNILIATDDSRLKLSATNLEIGITCWVPAKVETPGAVTVPARLLSDFVGSLPPERVTLDLTEETQTLTVAADRYHADIKGIDASDFPVLPTVDQGIRFTMSPKGLRETIGLVTIAAATDESRPILTGVLTEIDPDGGQLTLAAADGFRLSVLHAELDAPLESSLRVIIPARALSELSRIGADAEEPIEVAVTESLGQIMFRMKDVDLVSQLIDGSFPDYEKILPGDHSVQAIVNTRALHNAVKMASFFARDAANVVRIELRPGTELEPGTLVVTAQASEVGANESEIEASIEGGPLEIAFNAKYLMDILNVLGSDQASIELSSGSSPGVFRPVDNASFTHVIMPMHIGR